MMIIPTIGSEEAVVNEVIMTLDGRCLCGHKRTTQMYFDYYTRWEMIYCKDCGKEWFYLSDEFSGLNTDYFGKKFDV